MSLQQQKKALWRIIKQIGISQISVEIIEFMYNETKFLLDRIRDQKETVLDEIWYLP